jgi:hypothetical protein
LLLFVLAPAFALLAALGLYSRDPAPLTPALRRFIQPPRQNRRGGQVFHIGHSLRRDMPAGSRNWRATAYHASQLGWGLQSHWDPNCRQRI